MADETTTPRPPAERARRGRAAGAPDAGAARRQPVAPRAGRGAGRAGAGAPSPARGRGRGSRRRACARPCPAPTSRSTSSPRASIRSRAAPSTPTPSTTPDEAAAPSEEVEEVVAPGRSRPSRSTSPPARATARPASARPRSRGSRCVPGSGSYTINGRTLDAFFPRETLQRNIRQPLETVGYEAAHGRHRAPARRAACPHRPARCATASPARCSRPTRICVASSSGVASSRVTRAPRSARRPA